MLENFLKHTQSSGDCLIWIRCFNTDGYPRASWKGNSNGKVHRIVYSLVHPLEDITGKVIRHTCDNPKCINPDHLLSGTNADNMKDRDSRFRHGAAKITPAQVLEIRDMFKQNPKLKSPVVAAQYGISHKTVLSIKHGKHWKHLMT